MLDADAASWRAVVVAAQMLSDLSYEEWCQLYVNKSNPTNEQIMTASMAAKEILVQRGAIDPGLKIDLSEVADGC